MSFLTFSLDVGADGTWNSLLFLSRTWEVICLKGLLCWCLQKLWSLMSRPGERLIWSLMKALYSQKSLLFDYSQFWIHVHCINTVYKPRGGRKNTFKVFDWTISSSLWWFCKFLYFDPSLESLWWDGPNEVSFMGKLYPGN